MCRYANVRMADDILMWREVDINAQIGAYAVPETGGTTAAVFAFNILLIDSNGF